jgi:formylglycine-generating enzyme required for sulfatase activity
MEKYDIFISYRRETGRDLARQIKLELEKQGYNVFLDFDELKDGCYYQKIRDAIKAAPIFMVILSSHALDRCVDKEDWVRQEIEYAILLKKHIVPINPDSEFTGFPEDLPKEIKDGLGLHQYSEILFGQLFAESVRKMVRERIIPHIEIPRKKKKGWFLAGLIAVLIVTVVVILNVRRAPKTDVTDLCHLIINGVPMEMVYVEGGYFIMGSDSVMETKVDGLGAVERYNPGNRYDEFPPHRVYVHNFYIGKFEITQTQWFAIMNENPSFYKNKGKNLPVENISFYDAVNFIRRLNELTGLDFDFPTEAEWEYAARGGRKSENYVYSGSNNLDEVAWYKNNAPNNVTKEVGSKKPNELGIYDMSGNVWEWCRDYYDPEYYKTILDTIDPRGAAISSYRTFRGGSVQLGDQECRCANREGYDPSARDSDYGLRIVLRVI